MAASVLLLVAFLPASPAAAETNVSVSSPAGNLFADGKPIYVIVTVQPDQAIEGSIVINNDQGLVVATQTFEAAGGSTREVLVRVPIIQNNLNVEVETSDGESKTFRSPFRSMDTSQPVGIFPGLISPGNPQTVTMIGGSKTARLSRFDPSWLEYGPDVLEHHNALAMTAADFDALSEIQRQSLFFWISRGGRLVVDSPTDSPPAGLPASFDGSNKATYGTGTIALSEGRAQDGDFSGLFSSRLLSQGNQYSSNNPSTAIAELVNDAVIPEIPVNLLMPLMAIYVLVIGPGAWLWLKRRNGLPKLWLVVPLLAIVSTLGIWTTGTILRARNSGSHVTLVADYAGLTETKSQYLISTAAGGFTGVQLKDDWQQESVFRQSYDPFNGQRLKEATTFENQVGVDLAPGSSTLAGARKIESVSPSWQIDVATNGDSLTGTITNQSDFRLEDVVVAIASGVDLVSAVDPGETVSFEFENADTGTGNVHSRVVRQMQSSAGRDGSTSPGIYDQWSSSVSGSQKGHLVVVGWSNELDGPLVSTGGDTIDRGRTGFASMVELETTATSSQIGLLTVTDQAWYGDGQLLDGGGRIYPEVVASYQFDFERNPGQQQVVVDFNEDASAADFWDGTRWVPSGLASTPVGIESTFRIAPDLIVDGVLTFRIGWFSENSRIYNEEVDLPQPTVRFADGDDDMPIVGGDE